MTIWNLFAFLLVWAGHTELCVTFVNRVHALPYPCRRLKLLRRLHDLGFVLVPVVILGVWGFDAPGRFLAGRWNGLSTVAIVTFAAGAIGVAGLLWSIVRWWLFIRGSMFSHGTCSTIDVVQELGEPPIGPGHLHWLARVPRNEQFLIDINEKSITPPNWPHELDGFSILHISDWHLCPTYSRRFFECAADAAAKIRADLVAFTGDLFDDEDCLDWLPSTLGRLSAPLGQWFILGNHDSWLDHERLRHAMRDLSWRDLASQSVQIDAGPVNVWLGGDETPWMGRRPAWPPDAGTRILLSHTPDNFVRAASEGVDVVLAGHNHGGQVLLPLIGPVYSPSRYGCCYPSGIFRRGSSVMHVSRGLAGRHPLRIGCRPEVTRLVIRSPQKLNTSERATTSTWTMVAGGDHRGHSHPLHGRPTSSRR
jgi:uncharacterized protein